MLLYNITLKSKNKRALNNYLLLLKKKLKNIYIINQSLKNKEKKKFFSILKSPHVNKKSQEQFESKMSSISIDMLSLTNPYYLICAPSKIIDFARYLKTIPSNIEFIYL